MSKDPFTEGSNTKHLQDRPSIYVVIAGYLLLLVTSVSVFFYCTTDFDVVLKTPTNINIFLLLEPFPDSLPCACIQYVSNTKF
jgi:hypothetical protein